MFGVRFAKLVSPVTGGQCHGYYIYVVYISCLSLVTLTERCVIVTELLTNDIDRTVCHCHWTFDKWHWQNGVSLLL